MRNSIKCYTNIVFTFLFCLCHLQGIEHVLDSALVSSFHHHSLIHLLVTNEICPNNGLPIYSPLPPPHLSINLSFSHFSNLTVQLQVLISFMRGLAIVNCKPAQNSSIPVWPLWRILFITAQCFLNWLPQLIGFI